MKCQTREREEAELDIRARELVRTQELTSERKMHQSVRRLMLRGLGLKPHQSISVGSMVSLSVMEKFINACVNERELCDAEKSE